MAKINILEPSIYNLIAAGEVVERPASVAKELIENSIDAGAENIVVEIKNGGISQISVSDDGSGIEEDDIKSAFLPHATSKIKQADDLESILTLGFRGEALASIAAVSKVELSSKTAAAELGCKITVEGGKFSSVEKVARRVGTTVVVNDLFYCVPARAKFLKKPKTEEQEIANIVCRAILAHPKINFSFFVDGKKSMSSMGKTEKEAMFSVYGKESTTETLEVNGSRDGVSVFGYVGKPTFSKSNRTYQTLIVNGRYVINLTVQTAVSNAYGDFLMKRQYPFFVLYLNLPPTDVDVNVHPNKLDVKFLNTSLIYSVVFEAVSRALYSMDYIKDAEVPSSLQTSFSGSATREKIDKAGVNLNPFSKSEADSSGASDNDVKNIVSSVLISADDGNTLKDTFGLGSRLLEQFNNNFGERNLSYSEEPERKMAEKAEPKTVVKQVDFAENELKIVGKIFNTYLLIEWGNNVYFIDQHAAHERLRYDKLKSEYESKEIVIQPLLVPYILTLGYEDYQIVQDNLEAIKSVGFEIEDFGEKTFKISSVPAIVSDIDFNKFFGMFLEERLGKNKVTEAELIKDSLMQLACKSAIKGGDDITKSEALRLLGEMGDKNITLFCPHGRPVVVKISKSEIEKWFKRIV